MDNPDPIAPLPQEENPIPVTPPPPRSRYPRKHLIPLMALAVFLPAAVISVLTRQSIFSSAKRPACTPITKVNISPGQINTFIAAPPTEISALAYNRSNQPVTEQVTYQWGISSSNSIGNLKPQHQIALFVPQNVGTGNIWVIAKNSCTKKSVRSSVSVSVTTPASPSPTPSGTTPQPTSHPTPTPTPLPTPTPPPLSNAKRVFITSTVYNGNLGGLIGADNKCQDRAAAAGLTGQWKAWLSDNTASASSRLTHSSTPYVLLDNTVVANNWADLVDGQLISNITMDENRSYVGREVWTGTNQFGQINDPNISKCANWTALTNDSPSGPTGHSGHTDYRWTRYSLMINCANLNSLYCFEQ